MILQVSVPCKPEITDFADQLVINQNISCSQIAMNHLENRIKRIQLMVGYCPCSDKKTRLGQQVTDRRPSLKMKDRTLYKYIFFSLLAPIRLRKLLKLRVSFKSFDLQLTHNKKLKTKRKASPIIHNQAYAYFASVLSNITDYNWHSSYITK